MDFTKKELVQMHRYCMKYRDLVRSGKTPATEQNRKFRAFSKVTYAKGVACA
jgi:hypothetical protein